MTTDNWHTFTAHYGRGRWGRWLYTGRFLHGRGTREGIDGHVEWCLLNAGSRWNKTLGLQFGRNGSESDIGLDAHIPWLGSIYARLRSPWTRRFRIDKDSGDPNWYVARHYSLKFNYAGRWISGGWGELDGQWSKGQPWWQEWTLSPHHLWGRSTFEKIVEETGETVVPMPEGIYPATWERAHYDRRHVRWPGTWLDRLKDDTADRRPSVSLDVAGGIPSWGKGENSWDCGMDGTFGISGNFPTVEDAVAGMVRAVLRDRRKNGGPHDLPSPMNVGEAEAWAATERET